MVTESNDEGKVVAFDLSRFVRTIKTRQGDQRYLNARGRLAWLRHDWPAAKIATAQIEASDKHARFQCVIELPNGATATGHGSETLQDFPDFYEKAETKAMARACAVLGYGTEGALDLDDDEPLDGLPAAKGERAARRMDDRQRQQVDAQHAQNVTPAQPPPSNLPATRRAARTIGSAQDAPAGPSDDDAVLRDELRELGTRGFDLNRFLTGRNKELDDLTRGELEGILPTAREVVRKRVEKLTAQS
jgi:hypothetical protein